MSKPCNGALAWAWKGFTKALPCRPAAIVQVNAKRPAHFDAWSGLHFFSLVMHLNSVAHLCALFASTAADTDIAATSSATRAPNTACSHAGTPSLTAIRRPKQSQEYERRTWRATVRPVSVRTRIFQDLDSSDLGMGGVLAAAAADAAASMCPSPGRSNPPVSQIWVCLLLQLPMLPHRSLSVVYALMQISCVNYPASLLISPEYVLCYDCGNQLTCLWPPVCCNRTPIYKLRQTGRNQRMRTPRLYRSLNSQYSLIEFSSFNGYEHIITEYKFVRKIRNCGVHPCHRKCPECGAHLSGGSG